MSDGGITTVVIPTVARPALVARCLESILAGDRLPDRVIVCDQSADDRTKDVVQAMRTEVPITYLRLPVAAVSAARNAGIECADSDLVAFIDDDCIAAPGWLSALVDAYTRTAMREEVSGVAGAVIPLRTRAAQVPISSRTSRTERVFRAHEGGLERGSWAPWDVGTGANLLAPRAILLGIGGFDTTLGPGTSGSAAEDVDLLYRLAREGALVYDPAAWVYHPASTRLGRLRSRVRYGHGMGVMLAGHVRVGDPAGRALTLLYLRHRLDLGVHGGRWGPIETTLTLIGALPPLAGVGFRSLAHVRRRGTRWK